MTDTDTTTTAKPTSQLGDALRDIALDGAVRRGWDLEKLATRADDLQLMVDGIEDEPTELTPQQYALLDALRDVALSSADAEATKSSAKHLARMAGEAFGYPLPEPVQREGGLAGFLYGRPIKIGHEGLRAQLADAQRALDEIRPIVEELDDDTVHDGSYADILRSGIDRMKAAAPDRPGDDSDMIVWDGTHWWSAAAHDRHLRDARAALRGKRAATRTLLTRDQVRTVLAHQYENHLDVEHPGVDGFLSDATTSVLALTEKVTAERDEALAALERELREKRAATLDEAADIVQRELAQIWKSGDHSAVDQAIDTAAEVLRAEAREDRKKAERD